MDHSLFHVIVWLSDIVGFCDYQIKSVELSFVTLVGESISYDSWKERKIPCIFFVLNLA